MNKTLIVAMLLALCGVQAHASAVSSGGGKKPLQRRIDQSGNPFMFETDVAWKVFESTGANAFQIVDESGVAPKQGIINRVCIGTAAATNWAVVYDSNTTSGFAPNVGILISGKRLLPPIVGQTTLAQCFVINALFTSGAVVDSNFTQPVGGVYVYWREIGGSR